MNRYRFEVDISGSFIVLAETEKDARHAIEASVGDFTAVAGAVEERLLWVRGAELATETPVVFRRLERLVRHHEPDCEVGEDVGSWCSCIPF